MTQLRLQFTMHVSFIVHSPVPISVSPASPKGLLCPLSLALFPPIIHCHHTLFLKLQIWPMDLTACGDIPNFKVT